MIFDRHNYTDELLLQLYKAMLLPRLIEEKMLLLLRQGEVSKWFSGIGQEAIAVGVTMALNNTDYILPLHRNLGVFTSRGVDLPRLFAQLQGKANGFTKGRDRSFHFGSKSHHIVGMISHLGAQLAVADGIALAELLDHTGNIVVGFSGEGGASEGDFHESLNLAAVWNLPIIYLVENNGYGLSTTTQEQYKIKSFCEKGAGYGIDTIQIDGNNILEVYAQLANAAASIRKNPRPILIEAITFRMRGHEEASGTKYVPTHLFDEWELKDPISNFENYIISEKIITEFDVFAIRKSIKNEIDQAWQKTSTMQYPVPDTQVELQDVYAHYNEPTLISSGTKAEVRYIDAITQALDGSMQKYPQLLLMGQDIAEYGGVFKVTEGLAHKYGKNRVRNTPLCESAVIGAALGLSIKGYKSVVEMQFADFVSCGFNQIVNNLAKHYYRWGEPADVVIRMPTGAGSGAGPFHSQSTEAWFFHTAGLKIVFPSSPQDAKGLLNAAIADPNPVLFFEHKQLYRSLSDKVNEDYFQLPIGKANIVQQGDDISLITYGMGVHWAIEASKKIDGSIEILDLRSLMPWDKEAVSNTVMKTGKVLLLTEDNLTGSIISELAAWIGEHYFNYLDAPIIRVGSLDTPIPFANALENNYLPKERLLQKLNDLIQY